ncbi:MAG: ATP-dependent zinc metalloprotease FtsH [Pseudomonadota bacterium]
MSNHRLPPPDKQKGAPPDLPLIWWVWILAAALALSMLVPLITEDPADNEIPYSAFLDLVADGQIASVRLSQTQITAKRVATDDIDPGAEAVLRTYAPEIGDPALLELLRTQDVELVNTPPPETSWLLAFLPWMALIFLYVYMMRRAGGFGGPFGDGIGDFLRGGARKEEKGREPVTFADVAGQENAKREVTELVDFLREPDRFQKLGARAPRGVLLMGPPGTGKTLMARALAGEAGVPFFSTSASEFIEMFVGVGASRVRSMFEEAKKRAPAIIFIDELDSVGRVRGTGVGGGHDEREQTLNQILAEMDGFTGHEAVVVLAATNRPDVLDPALLRPGRFDRHVTLTLPSRGDRAAILGVHVRKVPLGRDVDLDVVAASTPGFSGADLKNLVNEAAITAARENTAVVEMRHLDEARDKVMMGTVRTLAISPEEKHRLAVHEAGHTGVAYFLPGADPLYKVTIIPRGQALGGTHMLPSEERHTLPENRLHAHLAVMLAGRAAERVFLGEVSSGADDDIKRATALARSMVGRWGMSPEIGPVDLRESEEHPFLGREVAQPRRFADRTAADVDTAVRELLLSAEAKAERILTDHKDRLERLVAQLEQEETLDRTQIEACLGNGRPGERSPRPLPSDQIIALTPRDAKPGEG